MKKPPILASLLLGFVTASVQAGQVAPPPPELYGSAFMGQSTGERMFFKTSGAAISLPI